MEARGRMGDAILRVHERVSKGAMVTGGNPRYGRLDNGLYATEYTADRLEAILRPDREGLQIWKSQR